MTFHLKGDLVVEFIATRETYVLTSFAIYAHIAAVQLTHNNLRHKLGQT